MTSIITS